MGTSSLRIVFAGTPEFAAQHLGALLTSEHQLVAIYTQPDRPAGRGKKLQASPVKQLALQEGIPVYQPATLKTPEQRDTLAALGADVMVVVAYGLILPQDVLDTPRLGCLNVHASLLPRWRGAAPIQRAIEAGDDTTGITVMQMDAGLDTGNILATASCAITPHTTAASLHDQLSTLGGPLLLRVLSDLSRYRAAGRSQTDEGASYASKILKSEAEIDWGQSATSLDRRVRAFNPFPVSYTLLAAERIKIWDCELVTGSADDSLDPGTIVSADRGGIVVRCGRGQLRITRLQLPGGKALSAGQLLNARADSFAPGVRLGETTARAD